MKRAIALFTLVFFLATSLNFPAANAANAGEPLPVPFSISKIQVPAQFGKIDDFFQGKSSQSVVLIQDAHAVPDAQRNIWRLIEHFEKEYGIKQVAVEGSASELDAQFFRSFPDKSRLKKVFEEYLQKGELSGPNAAALFSDSRAEYHGIEDWELYEEGLGYFLKAEEKRPEILRKLEMESKKLEEQKRGTYSKQLFEIDQELEKFQENHENLAAVLKKLALARRAPKGTAVAMLLEEMESDKGQWGRDEVKQEQKYSEMSGRFNREFEVYARSVKEKLFRNEEERELNRQSRGLYLLKKLAKLELSREEWKEVKPTVGAALRGRPDSGQAQGYGQPHRAAPTFEGHLAFYENAEKRDAVFFEKLKKLISLSSPHGFTAKQPFRGRGSPTKALGDEVHSTILVAGGFHTQGLTQRFKEAGISYVLVRPEIKDIPDGSVYRQQMRGDVSWKSYFRVENGKVNLSEAFVRAARDKLLNGAPALKLWRDQILLDLVQKGEITKARRYTRFLDELVFRDPLSSPNGLIGDPFSESRPDWMHRLDKFIEGLRHLEANHQLTEQNILQLFSALGGKPSAMPGATIANQFAARSELRADLIPGLMPLRGDVPSKAEARSAGESKVGINLESGTSNTINASDTAALVEARSASSVLFQRPAFVSREEIRDLIEGISIRITSLITRTSVSRVVNRSLTSIMSFLKGATASAIRSIFWSMDSSKAPTWDGVKFSSFIKGVLSKFQSEGTLAGMGELVNIIINYFYSVHNAYSLKPVFGPSRSEARTQAGHLKTGEIFQKRYQILKQVSWTISSEIYEAYDKTRKRPVILKLRESKWFPQLSYEDKKGKKLFEDNKEDPVSPEYLDLGKDEKSAWITVAKEEGQNVLDWSKGKKPAEVQDLFGKILETVAKVHQQKHLHLDLKASNTWVRPDGQIRLLDWEGALMHGMADLPFYGFTPAYSVPDNFSEWKNPVPQTDIFPLGMLLYFLATDGQHTFALPKVTGKVLIKEFFEKKGRMPNAREIETQKELRGPFKPFAPLIAKAIHAVPDQRYASIAEMRLDFFKIYGRIADQSGGIVLSTEQKELLEAQREQISRQYNLNEKARAGLEQAEVELRVNIFITGMPGGRELLRLRADNLLAAYKKKVESEKEYFQSNLFATPLLAAWMLQAGARFEEYDQVLEQANPAQRSRITDLSAYFKNYIEAHHYDPAWIKKINRSEARAPQEQIQFPIYLDAETVQAIESLEVLPVMQEVAKTKLSILYKTEIKVAGRKIPILLKRPRAQPTAEKQESAENAIKNEAENMREILEHPLFSKSGGKLYIEGKWWQHPNIRLGYWSLKLAGLVMPYLEPLQGATDAYDFFIERNTKLTPRQYFTIALEMAGAVGFLHHLGIVHHDIKPQNFFMTQHHPVLTDLNLTYNTKGSRLPIRGGTEMFSSEKHFKEDPRFTHDVYSLGVTILRIWLGIQGDEQGTEMGFTRLTGLRKKNQWTDEEFLEKINFKGIPPEMESVIRKAMGADPYKDAVEMEKAVREADNRFRHRSQKALEAKPSQPPVPEPSAEVGDPEAEFIPGVRWKLELIPALENLRHTGTEAAPKIRIPEQWDDYAAAKAIVKEIDPRLRFIGIAGLGTTGLVYLVERNGEPFALKIPVGAEYWNKDMPMNSDIQHNLLIDGARHIVEHDILLGFHAQSTKLVPGIKGFYEIRLLDTKGGEYPSTALLTEHVPGMEIEDYLRVAPGGQREFARQFTGIVMTLRGQDLSLQGLNEGDRLSLSARHFRMQDVPVPQGASPLSGNAEGVRLRLVGMAELYGAEGHSQIKKIEERDALPGILKSAIHKIFETILISQPASDAVVRIPPDDPQIEAGIAEGLDQFFKGSSTHLDPTAPKSEARSQTIESLLSVPERKYIIGIHERLSSWRLKVSLQKELQDISFARVPTPDQILEFQEEGYLNPKGGKVTEKTLAKVRTEILGIVAGPDKDPQKAFLETLQKKFFDLGTAALDEMGVWEQGLLGQMIAEEPALSPEKVQETFSFLEKHIQKLEQFWSPASREKKTKSGYVFHVWKEQLERKYAKRLRLTKVLLEMARRLHSGNYPGVGSFYEKMEANLKNDRDYQGFFQETARKMKRQAQERQGQDEVLQKNLDRFFFQAAEKSVVDRSDQKHLREKMAVDKPPLLIEEREGIFKVSPNPEYFNPFLGPNADTRYPLIPIAAALEDVLKRAGPEIREHLRLPAFKAHLDDDFISDLVFRMQHVLYERETGALREFIWEYLSDVLALEKGATAGDLGLYEKYLRFAREYWTREKPESKAAMLSSIAKLPSLRVVLEGEPGSRDPEAMVLEKNIYSFQPWRTVQTTEGPRLLPAEKIIFASWKGRRFLFYTSRSHMLQTTLARRWRQAEAVLGMWFVKQHPENIDDLPLNLSLLLDEAIRSPLMTSSSSMENWKTRLRDLGLDRLQTARSEARQAPADFAVQRHWASARSEARTQSLNQEIEILKGGRMRAGETGMENQNVPVWSEKGVPTGLSRPEKEAERTGDWHPSFEVYLFDDQNRILLPEQHGLLQIPAVKSIYEGDSGPKAAALKKTEEDFGIRLDPNRLIQISESNEVKYARHSDQVLENQFVTMFFYRLTTEEKERFRSGYAPDTADHFELIPMNLIEKNAGRFSPRLGIALAREGNFLARMIVQLEKPFHLYSPRSWEEPRALTDEEKQKAGFPKVNWWAKGKEGMQSKLDLLHAAVSELQRINGRKYIPFGFVAAALDVSTDKLTHFLNDRVFPASQSYRDMIDLQMLPFRFNQKELFVHTLQAVLTDMRSQPHEIILRDDLLNYMGKSRDAVEQALKKHFPGEAIAKALAEHWGVFNATEETAGTPVYAMRLDWARKYLAEQKIAQTEEQLQAAMKLSGIKKLTPDAEKLKQMIRDYKESHAGKSPSQAEVAEMAGVSLSTVQRWHEELKEAGFALETFRSDQKQSRRKIIARAKGLVIMADRKDVSFLDGFEELAQRLEGLPKGYRSQAAMRAVSEALESALLQYERKTSQKLEEKEDTKERVGLLRGKLKALTTPSRRSELRLIAREGAELFKTGVDVPPARIESWMRKILKWPIDPFIAELYAAAAEIWAREQINAAVAGKNDFEDIRKIKETTVIEYQISAGDLIKMEDPRAVIHALLKTARDAVASNDNIIVRIQVPPGMAKKRELEKVFNSLDHFEHDPILREFSNAGHELILYHKKLKDPGALQSPAAVTITNTSTLFMKGKKLVSDRYQEETGGSIQYSGPEGLGTASRLFTAGLILAARLKQQTVEGLIQYEIDNFRARNSDALAQITSFVVGMLESTRLEKLVSASA